MPHAEQVHWLFAGGFVLLGLCLVGEAVVGEEVWRKRAWRAQLWPALAFLMGCLLWPVMAFYTNSAIHMVAHGAWAQALMLAGGAELGLARGRLHSRWWRLCMPVGLAVSGGAFLLHEQNEWLFARSAFLHHLLGWTLVIGALFPLLRVWRPRSFVAVGGFAVLVLAIAVMLFSDRDVAPIFGHLSEFAGPAHR
jgi:hypothetical protein